MARPFDVARWFAVLSLVCVLASAAGSALVLSRFLTNHMLERDAAVSAEFVGSIVRAERTWSWFADPASAEAHPALESFFNHVAQLPGVVRANVFAADGTVIWSSNAGLVGRRFTGNRELDQALAGRIMVETGSAADLPKAEHVALDAEADGARFMEAYLPVWNADRCAVIGVVEIYRLPLALFRAIDEGVRLVWLSAGAGAALLYGALSWLVCRARRAIRDQQARLVEAEALAAVGAVASAVAHGIRNPLASIRTAAELAAEEEERERARECLTDIQRECDRVEGWVRDLLLHARGEVVAPGAVDVNALLRESARSFAAAAERQRVRLELRPGAVPAARGNPGPLAQAIDNLVANAIEAMPEGGALVLETRAAEAGRAVEIRVADSGTGLPEALLAAAAAGARGRRAAAARPFFSTKARGTGLGLALARRIVGRYAGTLRLESAVGRGTTATIRLPAAVGG